jgi:hypothetical protein
LPRAQTSYKAPLSWGGGDLLAARPSWAASASLLHALAQLAFPRRGSNNKALRAHDMPNCPVENLAYEATDSEFSLQQGRADSKL